MKSLNELPLLWYLIFDDELAKEWIENNEKS